MRCPGQDTRYWKEDAIFEVSCPDCKAIMEFFKDDTVRKCKSCGKTIPNPRMDFGCAAYCKYADICLGELPPELVKQRAELLKDRVVIALERELKDKEKLSLIKRASYLIEKIFKEREESPGLPLLITYFYYLSEEEREHLYRVSNLPETLFYEIRDTLEKLPPNLTPEELTKQLISQ
ncbi:MAG: hypothetical protein NZ530_02405 [Thermodesulfobacteriaceae bacterium]|nr:hypothetical protein [Thermodesulfobacteriaceae bacterium]MCX8041366.1 hypothetical protein [Thermodesulfobacteriaceae bacterium]MDW8135628.1 hypothetical protein [Thermodesulfobacterium sp.]